MIKEIIIENLKNSSGTMAPIKFSKELKPLNFIVGENGSGKSSFISILKSNIEGKQLPNFSYDKFVVRADNGGFENFNSLNIKNIYAEMFFHSNKVGLDTNTTAWIVNPQFQNNSIFNYTNSIVVQKMIVKSIHELVKSNYSSYKDEEYFKTIDWRKSNGFTSLFMNNVVHVAYRLNGILSNSDYFAKPERVNIINDIRNILLDRKVQFNGEKYKTVVSDVLNHHDWLTSEEVTKINIMMDNFAKGAKEANVYINSFMYPLKSDPILLNEIEFIHAERIAADVIKREGINFNNVKEGPLKHELDKDHDKFLIDYNAKMNSLLNIVKTKILDNIHSIEVGSGKINVETESIINKSLSEGSSSDLQFIKNIMSSQTSIAKSVRNFITNDPDLISSIEEIKKMESIISECIDGINGFLADTFRLEIRIIDNKISVISEKTTTSVDKFVFSTGQKSIIYLLSNLYLTRKKIYVIDEPELGLSIIWQDKLKRVFKKIAKLDKQLIIITHSDFIFERERDISCVIPF